MKTRALACLIAASFVPAAFAKPPIPERADAPPQPQGAGQVSGSFRVSFDANGRAVTVQTIRSTGNSTLDQAAVSALHQWRSEAGQEWSLVVPITFKP